MKTERKIALVTGASRGIGRAIALKLAELGTNVYVNYFHNSDAASETLKIIKDNGGNGALCPFDVSDYETSSTAIKTIIEQSGRLDILVNNAGISINGFIMRIPEEDWDSTVAVNLKGAFNCCKAASTYMIKQRWGRIVNISSVIAVGGNAGQVSYAAAKAGILGLTKSLAKELGPRNITVNAVAPGFVDTDMTVAFSGNDRKKIIKLIPLGRCGTPEDVAGVVAFLVSKEAEYITGEVINISGGLYM